MTLWANHLLVVYVYQSYVVNWPIQTIKQCLRQKNAPWVDTYPLGSTHSSEKIGYESTHSLIHRLILLSRSQNISMKGAWVDTKHVCVDTSRKWVNTSHYASTHTELIWFGRGKESYVSMHNSMCRHIIVQNEVVPSFYIVFELCIYILHYCPLIRCGCNI